MRSRIFCKKFKSLTFVVLSALLVLPTILNVVKFTTPTFAEVDNNKSYAIELYDRNGNLIANTTAQGRTLFANNGTDDIFLSYVIAGEGSTDSNGNYPDCILGNNARCQLIIRNNGSVVATVSIPADKLSNLQIRSIVQITPSGTTCTLGSNSNGCLSSEIYATDFGSPTGYGYIDSYGSGTTAGNTIPIATALSQYYDPAKEPEAGEPQTEATCHSTSGAVGWFVCPILELAASATQWAYSTVIEPSLKVRTDLFQTTGSNNGTYQAWSTFRDMANIVFVILLLVIIFSQVTGIGIDNYGIKKTLPNLIVAAVLVNLSFIICQGAVDISNIAGSGIYDLLNNIGGGITVPDLGLGGGIAYTTSIINTVALAIGAGVVGTVVAGGFWAMISGALLAVLPVFISAVVAILFLFFMLAMRQAVVVMLVAIAPLAFVCYTLPNTKRLFSRWAELLRGMLVLYPICAVMIAGGRLASKIILSTGAAENNLFIILIAMVAEAGPLFLIPGLTRNAYRATGQLGTALNGLRARWTGGARNAVRGNQAYQRAVARGQRNRATGGLSQRRINQYNVSAAKTPGARNLRDRWNLRAGNRERIATLNQAALKAEEERRGIDQMSDATQVAGMRAQARISHAATQGKNAAMGSATDAEINAAVAGAATQAQISANQQMVNNADYANATFANAVIQQNTVDHENSTRQQLNWNNLQYRQGKRNAGRLAAENDLEDTILLRDRDVVSGKREQARIARDASRQNAVHYNDATFQQAAAAQLARKEIDDNIKSRQSLLANGAYSYTDGAGTHTVDSFNTGQLRAALENALGDDYHGEDRAADINAIMNTLASQGDAGRTAVTDAMRNSMSAGIVSDDARRAYSQNIMQYHAADYKANQRSAFDFAMANTGENAAQITLGVGGTRAATFADYEAKSVGSLKQEQLATMDEAELRRYFNALTNVGGARLTREDTYANHAAYVAAEQAAQQQLQQLARDTLSNGDIAKMLKGSQRALIDQIATGTAATP